MRISGLDFVRGVAVILVLFRHGTYECFIKDIGWAGVDLFFSMSGFLIASLVIKEYQATGSFDAKLFLIRRGFKIYPAFYVFLICSLLVNAIEHNLSYELRFILAEIFFLQSYLPHVWTHTWSLAVEEHFYFALAILAGLGIHKWNPSRQRSFFIATCF